MALKATVNAAIWQDQYDISGYSNKVGYNPSRDLVDTTVFGSSGHIYNPILTQGAISVESFLDDVAAGSWDAAKGKRTATSPGVITVLPEGSGYGNIAIFAQYWQESLPVVLDIADIVKFSQNYKLHDEIAGGDRGLQEGIVLYPKTTIATATTTSGTGQDGTGATSNGYTAALHVFSLTSGDTVDVDIEMDDNAGFTSASTLVSFTQATAATSEYASATTGSVERYVRASIVTTDAGGGGISTALAIVFKRR